MSTNPVAKLVGRAELVAVRARRMTTPTMEFDAVISLAGDGNEDLPAIVQVEVHEDERGLQAELVGAWCNDPNCAECFWLVRGSARRQREHDFEIDSILPRCVEACELKAIELYKERYQ